MLRGEALGPVASVVSVNFATGVTDGTEAGIVFGYVDTGNYWLRVYQYNAAGTLARVYQVAGGIKYLVHSVSMGVLPLDANLSLPIGAHANGLHGDGAVFSGDGFPSGRYGLYATSTLVKFDERYLIDPAHPADFLGRWRVMGSQQVTSAPSGSGGGDGGVRGWYNPPRNARTFSTARTAARSARVGYSRDRASRSIGALFQRRWTPGH